MWYISGYHCKLPGSYQLPTRYTAGSHYSLVPRPCWRRKWPENKVTSHDLPVKVDELVVHFRRLPDHFTILLFLFSHLGLSLAAAPLHFISLADMAEGGHPAEESFDSGMFQSKFIHCCITSICTYTLDNLQRLILAV